MKWCEFSIKQTSREKKLNCAERLPRCSVNGNVVWRGAGQRGSAQMHFSDTIP